MIDDRPERNVALYSTFARTVALELHTNFARGSNDNRAERSSDDKIKSIGEKRNKRGPEMVSHDERNCHYADHDTTPHLFIIYSVVTRSFENNYKTCNLRRF